MRRTTSLCFALLLAAGLSITPGTLSAPKNSKLRPPLELKISGPAYFRYGQKLKFKAVLVNRSSAPIVLAQPPSSLSYQLDWKILDPTGQPMKSNSMICPLTGIKDGTVFPLADDDVRILKPGDKLEYEEDDIGTFYEFPRGGRYQVVATYVFPVPQFTESGDRIADSTMTGVPILLDLRSLSTAKIDALKHAVELKASSNPWSMQLVE